MTESDIVSKMQLYLGEEYDVVRLLGQGWHIRYNDRNIALITDEAIMAAFSPRKNYIHRTDCLRHPDNKEELDAYYESLDMFPGDCDCPYESLPPYGFSIIQSMLRRVNQRVQEAKRKR